MVKRKYDDSDKLGISVKKQTIKKKQVEILGMKSKITKMENSLKGFNSRFQMTGEIIRKHEDRPIEKSNKQIF